MKIFLIILMVIQVLLFLQNVYDAIFGNTIMALSLACINILGFFMNYYVLKLSKKN